MLKFIRQSLLLLSLIVLSCANSQASPTNVTDVVKGLNEFSFDIYPELSKSGQNEIFSPYSLSFLLGILVSGSAGDTRAQLVQVLHLPQQNPGNVSTALNQVNSSLLSNQNILVANALWADEKVNYKPSFLSNMEQIRSVSFNRVNFVKDASSATKKINNWVATNTNGYIKTLFDAPLSPATRLVLTNAIYFKGLWSLPFKSGDTIQQPFTLESGAKTQVAMMHMTDKLHYAENDKLQMLQLNYANSSLAMIVILPKDKNKLTDILQFLNQDNFQQLSRTAAFSNTKVILSLPKFKLSSTYADLISPLTSLGLKAPFSSNADFSNLIETDPNNPLYISQILQKAIIEVDEKGTVAAAATGMTLFGTAIEPAEPRRFTADHPFLFMIVDTQTMLVMFMGQVNQP